jgi:hypothetical protein
VNWFLFNCLNIDDDDDDDDDDGNDSVAGGDGVDDDDDDCSYIVDCNAPVTVIMTSRKWFPLYVQKRSEHCYIVFVSIALGIQI